MTQICQRRESLQRDPQIGFTKVYSVSVPALSPDAVEQRFRDSARELQLQIRTAAITGGLEAARGDATAGASLVGDQVMVILAKNHPDPRGELERLVAKGPPVLAALVPSFGGLAALRHVTVSERQDRVDSVELRLDAPARGEAQAKIAEAAQRFDLTRHGDAWIRRPAQASGWGIHVDLERDALSISAFRKADYSHPSCKRHAARQAPASRPGDSERGNSESEEQLMEDFMGD
jgi:hypothetical protein